MKNGLVIYKDGTKSWYLDDKLHRKDSPAIIRSNGHAIIWFDGGEMESNISLKINLS